MIKYVCVHGYAPHKKGDVLDMAPPGSGNAFVPRMYPDPIEASPAAVVHEGPASVVIKQPQRTRFSQSRQEPE